ncbi:MAG: ATP-binding cassette domain-containing protein [Kofleriaceae bacterium]
MSEPLIALHQAGVAHGVVPVLVDADLTVAAGEVVVVASPAGSGATALIELVTGQRAGTGKICLAGRDLGRLRASSLTRLRRRLGIIPEDLVLAEGATALANVEVALEIVGVARRARAETARAALAAVEVEADVPVARLGRAARQRVAWARAFVREPDILIADQPSSYQDPAGTALLVDQLTARAAAGGAALVASRDPALVAAAAARGWRTLTIHAHRLVDPATVLETLDATGLIEAEIERPSAADAADAADAIPNVVQFPLARSAGHRR